jgi:DNA excision repair protein ERCC-2
MKLIQLSVCDFALPVPRTGSIELHSGYGKGSAEGQEIHQRVQEKRARAHNDYRAEVAMTHDFDRDGYRFRVSGRADGVFDSTPPVIEEIKTAFSIHDLSRKLIYNPDHPYVLQLKTYGYLFWLQNREIPKLTFHLVSSRNYLSEDREFTLEIESYETWLDRRLEELVALSRAMEKRADKRRRMAEAFAFPFANPRPGQESLVGQVGEAVTTKARLLVQAPTGLGKTAGVLYPALKESLSRGQSVIYVTPKNSQHSVAEDAVERFQDTGTKIRSLTITAKSKLCFKAEPLCNPDYCEFAKDYYTKIHEHKLPEVLAKKKKLNAKTFQKLGEEHEVCPFELQLEAVNEVETVICDYNYVFAPRAALQRFGGTVLGQEGLPNLVIDEAHNLPSRAMDYYSPSLSSIVLDKMRPAMRELPARFRADGERLIDDCLSAIAECRPEKSFKPSQINAPVGAFLEREATLRAFLSKYLDSDVEIKPGDVVMRLSFYWTAFTDALALAADPERTEFVTTYHPLPLGGIVKITCCDASQMLEECYDSYESVVGFSATLKPFDYYAKLSGLDPEKIRTAEFQSPFPPDRRKLLIIPQISTKYSDRERSYPKIAETIYRLTSLRQGNYFVFFPSFEFLTRVYEQFRTPEGFRVMRQERHMKGPEIEMIIDFLRGRSQPTVMFAVQGGVFSEGVDYPGETIIGAFIVGPPLPNFDLERELMREHYQSEYGAGFDYAYTFPAMAKAVQAAGRVIRSETDRGLIVLMDNRFVQPSYSRTMPADWYRDSPQELVSSALIRDVQDFWQIQDWEMKALSVNHPPLPEGG